MEFIRKHTNILFVFILPVYFYIVQNTIQNKHTHVYANGVVVTHSHPVDGGDEIPINEHDHTKSEICLYSSLHFDIDDDNLSSPCLLAELSEEDYKYFVSDDELQKTEIFQKSRSRAPPEKCFSNLTA